MRSGDRCRCDAEVDEEAAEQQAGSSGGLEPTQWLSLPAGFCRLVDKELWYLFKRRRRTRFKDVLAKSNERSA